MNHHTKQKFEMEMVKLLNLPEHTRWFELRCAFAEIPTVKCEYEVWDGDNPMIDSDKLMVLTKKYEVILKEIEENENDY